MEVAQEKTIWDNEKGFVRVRLTPEELSKVYAFVMNHNMAVAHQCLERADKEFPQLEPARRLQIALLLADKASVHVLTAHREALDAKVAAIKDAAKANGTARRPVAAGVKNG